MELIAMVSSFFIVYIHTEFLLSDSYNHYDSGEWTSVIILNNQVYNAHS